MATALPQTPWGAGNRLFDDEQGDSVTGLNATYLGTWNYGPGCTICHVSPNASLAVDGSWHEVTVSENTAESDLPSVELDFVGTEIYVFGIVANTLPDTETFVNTTFVLDDETVGSYIHVADTSDSYLYNVSMHNSTGLPNSQHTLRIVPQGGSSASFLAFDYAIYTFDDSAPSTVSGTHSATASFSALPANSGQPASTGPVNHRHKSAPVAAIAGGVVGGLVLLVFAALAFLFLRHRRNAPAADRIRHSAGEKHFDEEIGVVPFQPFMPSVGQSESSLRHNSDGRQDETSTSFVNGTRDWRRDPSAVALGASTTVVQSDDEEHGDRENILLGLGRNPPPAPGTKAAMRQAELTRRLQEMERHMADLETRRAGSSRLPTSMTPPSVNSSAASEQTLRFEVEALRAEVERLRAERGSDGLSEPPPAYEGSRQSRTRVELGRATLQKE